MSSIKKDKTMNKQEKDDKKPTVKSYNKSDLINTSKYSFYQNRDIDKFNECSFESNKKDLYPLLSRIKGIK